MKYELTEEDKRKLHEAGPKITDAIADLPPYLQYVAIDIMRDALLDVYRKGEEAAPRRAHADDEQRAFKQVVKKGV